MSKNNTIFGRYFCGNEISAYGLKNGFVDYRTFASAFDGVMNNDIMNELENHGYYFEPVNGFNTYDEEIEELQERIEELEAEIEETEECLVGEIQCNIDELQERIEELEDMNGFDEIFQYFIVDDRGAELIQDYTNDPLFYCSELDLYIWGVTHWGTSWDYVLTSICCEKVAEA